MTSRTPTWVVGHDGSAGAGHAFDWVIAQAACHRFDISLVRAWDVPALEYPLAAGSIEEFAPRQVCEGFDEVVSAADDVGAEVTSLVVRGGAARVLLEESTDGAMLVVGSRGLGGFKRLLVGSVSSQCATHARVPTAVVPAATKTDRPVGRIVVGFDGSDRSMRAMEWAMSFAADPAQVTVVGAWQRSSSGYVAVVQQYAEELADVRADFHRRLDEFEATGAGGFERRFVHADPAITLTEAGADADMVVVGQRGHSGLGAVVLGSVSTYVLHHSESPVVVVPMPADA